MPRWICAWLAAIILAVPGFAQAADAPLERSLDGLIASLEGKPRSLVSGSRDDGASGPVSELAAAIDAAETLDQREPATNSTRISIDIALVGPGLWRGAVRGTGGTVLQPSVKLSLPLVQGGDQDDFHADVVLGFWNSVRSERAAGHRASWDAWYDTDVYLGVSLGQGPFELGLTYTAYIHPNIDDTDTVHEVGIEFGMDLGDGVWLTQLLGKPTIGVFAEVSHSNVRDFDEEAAYAELAFGPTIALSDTGVTLDIPVQVGVSVNDYYVERSGRSHAFGFASVGVGLSIPVNVSHTFKSSLRIGGTWHVLGQAARDVNDGQRSGGFLFVALTLEF